jgi:hypothetical protein
MISRYDGWRVLKTGLAGLVLVGAVALGGLAPQMWGMALRVARTDEVHYGGHLVAGRLFSLWPGGADMAEEQYTRGLYHARTPRQAALLTTQRPSGAWAHLEEARMVAAVAARRVIGG